MTSFRGAVRSVARAFDILEYLSEKGSCGVSELSRELGIPKSSLYYLLETIRERGYIEKDDRDRFSLNLKLFRIASKPLETLDVLEYATCWVEKVVRETGETCKIAVLEGNEAIVIYKVDAPHAVRVVSRIGAKENLHATALGKVLLAWLPEQQVRSILEQVGMKKLTPNTITDIDRLLAELERVRQTGVAFDDRESNSHARCVACPIMDSSGRVVAGISVSGPSDRVSVKSLNDGIADVVKRAAQNISRQLGFNASESTPFDVGSPGIG